jgi:branched-chain amino acid transport system ATP-binding protein
MNASKPDDPTANGYFMKKNTNTCVFAAKDVSKNFGGIHALSNVTLTIGRQEIISMIGPNGAGKSTFINVVTGVYAPDTGDIRFQGRQIAGLPAHVIARLGIGRTFQLEELFPNLTVLENAMVGCHTEGRCGIFSAGLRLSAGRREEHRIRQAAMENLDLIGLTHRADQAVQRLPLGERKLVGIARALGMKPTLLLMDEPVGGLAAHETEKLTGVLQTIVENGLTILIVEHNMPFVMSISQRVIVLDGGQKLVEGTPDEVKNDSRVIQAYLGEEV